MDDQGRIWLKPICQLDFDERARWAEGQPEPCDSCGMQPVEYIRADLVATIRAERDGLLALILLARADGRQPHAKRKMKL